MIFYKFTDIKAGIRLIELIGQEKSAHLAMPCGGMGRCGKCRVRVSGAVQMPDEAERKYLSESELTDGIRLACRALTAGGAIEIGIDDSDDNAAIEITGASGDFNRSPICDGDLGIAVDIGTTTAVVYLCDLKAGKIINTAAFQNPQREYGADVITRIGRIIDDYSMLKVQKSAILSEINRAVASFGVDKSRINAAVLTGNTVMLHIAAEEDPRGIANAPFTPSTLFGYKRNAKANGLDIADNADVYYMPCFSAYVGGDIATGMAASGFDERAGKSVYIDVGTNGEMGIGGRDGITLCATAAGPAFEGAHIECGMGGVSGAVRRVKNADGKIDCDVIGGGEAVGLCGSALIDTVAVMLDMEALDETGRLDEDVCAAHNTQYRHDNSDRFYITENVYISDKDIREVQLAKAAIAAGIMTLLDDAGITAEQLENVIVAGGFGSHIDPASACRIGLFPSEMLDKIITVGNTAGSGAVLYLMSDEARKRIDGIKDKSRYLELSGNDFFMDEYIERMIFE